MGSGFISIFNEALKIDKILLGEDGRGAQKQDGDVKSPLQDGVDLKYSRDSGAVFVDFPETLRAGQTYAIDFYYSGNPVETGRFGSITFKKDPAGRRVDQYGLRRDGREHVVAEQGSVARRSGGDGDQRRGAEWVDGCVERKICGEDGSRRWVHAMGLDGALSDQQLRRVAEYREV